MEQRLLFSYAQIQVLEYLLENEEQNQNMSQIASRHGITLNNFSKLVNKIEKKGLVEKFFIKGNRKSIVIPVSPLGRQVYEAYSNQIYACHFIPNNRIDIAEILHGAFDFLIRRIAGLQVFARIVFRRL